MTPAPYDPLLGEHYCGKFPGAGGVMLANKISIYAVDLDGVYGGPSYRWWNAKEGNGHNHGGPFASSVAAFADALKHYPAMAECDTYAEYVRRSTVPHIPVPTRNKTRRTR